MIATATSWQDVALALIAALPGVIAAIAALRIHSQIKTPSGKSIGKQVEDVVHTALANHYRLRVLNGEDVAAPSEAAQAREEGAAAQNRAP